MKADISVTVPADDAEWDNLLSTLNSSAVAHPLLNSLFKRLREAGTISVLQEHAYIDRDFSAAYSAFYSGLFRPYRKFCKRLHFFTIDVSGVVGGATVHDRMAALAIASDAYLGAVVLRPLDHAPVSSALLSAEKLAPLPTQEPTVVSTYRIHLLGHELQVNALPLTQQDTRTGACAQAAMWMAGRHFANRHSGPWFSTPDITEIALNPIDGGLTRSLPAGSEWLTSDSMVRALRAMGRHPVMYAPDALLNGVPTWQQLSPRTIVARYVDSGIPVLLGLQHAGTEIGHGVVVVGMERDPSKDLASLPAGSTMAEFVSHFLVNDDQRGAYCRLPVEASAVTVDYPFSLEGDVKFILVPLPAKVFLKSETAEIASRSILAQIGANRLAIAAHALGPLTTWNVDKPFYNDLAANSLVTRTYLTYGWKYKARMLRNEVSELLKAELLETQLPRFVWVTEFSLPSEAADINPCKRQIRAHVVIDATGSPFGESPLILHAPGLSIVWRYDPSGTGPNAVIGAEATAVPYWPKIRGEMDYTICGTTTP